MPPLKHRNVDQVEPSHINVKNTIIVSLVIFLICLYIACCKYISHRRKRKISKAEKTKTGHEVVKELTQVVELQSVAVGVEAWKSIGITDANAKDVSGVEEVDEVAAMDAKKSSLDKRKIEGGIVVDTLKGISDNVEDWYEVKIKITGLDVEGEDTWKRELMQKLKMTVKEKIEEQIYKGANDGAYESGSSCADAEKEKIKDVKETGGIESANTSDVAETKLFKCEKVPAYDGTAIMAVHKCCRNET